MNKIIIAFKGNAFDFTYYASWMNNGHHLFFVITDNQEAISILQLNHFFINIDMTQGGQYFMNVIKNTPEEVEFKDMIAREIIAHYYQPKPATSLN